MTLAHTGWQPEVAASAMKGKIPWVYVLVMMGWAAFLHAWSVPLYQWALARHGAFFAGPGLGFCFHVVMFHLAAGLHALMDALPRGPWARFKMHRRDKLAYADILPNVLFNQFVVYTAAAAALYWVFGGRGLQALPEPPTALQYACHNVLHYLLYETGFYWAHRALHHRALYAHHRLHHTTKGSVGVSGLYNSPLDFLLTQALPALLGPVLMGTHIFVVWMFIPIGSFNSVHSHGAYQFPGLPDPLEHSDHHHLYQVNFGTGPWDYLLGTHLMPSAKKLADAEAVHRQLEKKAA
jgi:sterol desaturase/sphingolipid hydroxylase (fatty acid hydroxylase superfamily)